MFIATLDIILIPTLQFGIISSFVYENEKFYAYMIVYSQIFFNF